MKIGLFSDVHGNIAALEACYAIFSTRKVDRLIFLGDAVGYLPFSVDCLKFIRDLNIDCIMGNHEAMLLDMLPVNSAKDEFYKLKLLRNVIDPELLDFVSGWAETLEIKLGDSRGLLVHGSPKSPLLGYVYPDTDLRVFEDVNYEIIVMGQTHRPFIRQQYGKIFVNIGSVGLPRDSGNLLSCAIFDTDSLEFEVIRQEFEIEDLVGRADIHPNIRSLFLRRSDSPYGTVILKNSIDA